MSEANTLADVNSSNELVTDYQPHPNVYDEMFIANNQIRPHWEYLIRSLKSLGRSEIERRWQEARRLLRDNGVTYNIYGDPQGRDRPWQLDPVPMLISSEEWGAIERGLLQRAELMNLLLADIYGAREVLRKGLVPPELIIGHPGFLRAADGIKHNTRHRLPLYAVDLVRAANGNMWALADRTQSPSGAGYALENRLILSRILPSLFRDSHVHRLALFFRTLRSTLASMSKHEDPRVVLLTPGPHNETYFEHAYLAKYLGYTLVQGADLTVRDGKAFLKTLDGLQSVDVILRRVNDSFCDPLELRPDSYSGVAGLMQAIRMRNIMLANPIGSSVLENPGLHVFLPALSKHFLGEELLLQSPMTWWCGERKSRDYVLANLDKLVVKRIAAIPGMVSVRGRLLSQKQLEMLRGQIRAQPHWFVGAEEAPRSTTPVLVNVRLEPRQMILRSFLVSGETGYVVMPGGLTRVASSNDTPIISSQNGGISKDTWVIASEPERQLSLVPDIKTSLTIYEGQQGELPSRVAENLYWLGRYAERAEGTIRLLRSVLLSLLEPYDLSATDTQQNLHKLLRAVTFLTETYPGFVGDGAAAKLAAPETELLSVFLDRNRIGSLSSTLQFLLNAARSVRDRVSPDMWRVISDIDDALATMQRGDVKNPMQLSDALLELDNLITALAAFAGLSMESMTHGQGWRFLMIGRRLERSWQTGQLLRAMLTQANADDASVLEHLLTITDSLMTYRRRYRSQLQVNAALELILQNESNPRAIGYQLERLYKYIRKLPRSEEGSYRMAEERIILDIMTKVRLVEVDLLAKVDENNFRKSLDALLETLERSLPLLSDAITNSYFSHAEQPRQLVKLGAEVEAEA